jgi:hypothetical protein
MRQNKINPLHTKTRLYSEVEKALKAGIREVVLSLPGETAKRTKLIAMHVMGDRVLFFDPEMNPDLSYSADLGKPGMLIEDGLLPQRRYEGNGLHSFSKKDLADLFYDGKAFALIPREAKLLAG